MRLSCNDLSYCCMTIQDKPILRPVLTKVNKLGKPCWATSHELNMNETRYENSIPEDRYRNKANTRHPMAGGGDREGSWKAGTSIIISTIGMRKMMASAMKSWSK